MKTIIEMAREAGKDISPDHGLVDFLKRLESIVRSDERKLIYDLVMFAPFKDDADLLMPESEVNPDEADDFFQSAEFRYAMNNTVKATTFTICSEIIKRDRDATA